MPRCLTLIALLGFSSCLPSAGPSRRPIEPVEPTVAEWSSSIPGIVAAADGVTVASITKIEDDWTYDAHCGILAALLGACTGQTFTQKITLSNKLTLWTWTT